APLPPQTPAPPAPPMRSEDIDGVPENEGGAGFYQRNVNRLFRLDSNGMEGRNPEAALNPKVQALLRKLEAAKEQDKRNTIIEDLRKLINQQFDLRLERQARDVQALEAKVKNLKELIAKREKNRDDIVSRKLEQIIRDSEGLGF
ncbi:hypothetical protein ACYOEI_38390, partial [Singulisphaera rosea]